MQGGIARPTRLDREDDEGGPRPRRWPLLRAPLVAAGLRGQRRGAQPQLRRGERQVIYVYPEMGLVIVMTGGNYDDDLMFQNQPIIRDYILPAVIDGGR